MCQELQMPQEEIHYVIIQLNKNKLKDTAKAMVDIIADGQEVVIAHGNK